MQKVPLIKIIKENTSFRKVLFTHKFSQLEVMTLRPGEDTGPERHNGDQLLVFISGQGILTVGQEESGVEAGDGVVVPAKTLHNLVNSSEKDLKLFALHSPPEHMNDTSHSTKDSAITDPFEAGKLAQQ
jgi:mannose-6-phosphate isomerase-like protein (cupin superfamily)